MNSFKPQPFCNSGIFAGFLYWDQSHMVRKTELIAHKPFGMNLQCQFSPSIFLVAQPRPGHARCFYSHIRTHHQDAAFSEGKYACCPPTTPPLPRALRYNFPAHPVTGRSNVRRAPYTLKFLNPTPSGLHTGTSEYTAEEVAIRLLRAPYRNSI